MSSLLGDTGGKSRSFSGFAGGPLRSIDKNLVSLSGTKGLNNTLIQQITEALRTGGIGAQLPIVNQAVSGASQATSDALRATQDSLATSGLTRTPYGQSILAGQRQQGAQATARIPTDYASQYIAQAPQMSQGLLSTILGALRKSSSQAGPYAT